MSFIALVVALLLLQYWGSARPLHNDEWYRVFVEKLAGSGLPPAFELAVGVLLPAALAYWVLDASDDWFFGLFALALVVLLLLFSFGRGDYDAMVTRYRDFCRAANFEGAFLYARQELESECGSDCPEEPEKLHRWMKERIAYVGFERWFAVIFYFALFGAAAAVAYRLLHLYGSFRDDDTQSELQRRVLQVIDWLPSRALVFAFALTGDWVGSREQVAASLQDFAAPADETLVDAAHAALGLKATVFAAGIDDEALAKVSDAEVRELQGLLTRSAIAWVVVISLLVVFI